MHNPETLTTVVHKTKKAKQKNKTRDRKLVLEIKLSPSNIAQYWLIFLGFTSTEVLN